MTNFKDITTVPSHLHLIDIVLNKTQRKTPTVIHPTYHISKIRSFYTRKIRFATQTFTERLTAITREFPRLEAIHPFYGDLMNVLYDRDTYKMALGHVSSVKQGIESTGREYVKLVKYADTLYRAKNLKRAALGRMATAVKRLSKSLEYLEEVRMHLGRLPSISPDTLSILLCGYPNVGKSSFVNAVSRAQVDVQPYAFTTKNLYVGHFDYGYSRWQVIDTPGILDHPIEERNTIEMQTVTALAHVQSTCLFVVDLTMGCGYGIEEQVSLCESLEPLLGNVLVVLSKSDLFNEMKDNIGMSNEMNDMKSNMSNGNMSNVGMSNIYMSNDNNDNISMSNENNISMSSKNFGKTSGVFDKRENLLEDLKMLEILKNDPVALERIFNFLNTRQYIKMSTATEQNVEMVKKVACEMLINKRVEKKLNSEKISEFINRIKIVRPKIEHTAECGNQVKIDNIILEKDLFEKDRIGYVFDEKKEYFCGDKYDAIPEIWEGKNFADFVDADIEQRILDIEKEEEGKTGGRVYDVFNKEEREYRDTIRARKTEREIIKREKGRATMPKAWLENRKKVTGPIVMAKKVEMAIEQVKIPKGNFRFEKNKRYFDAKPKHIFRSSSKKGEKGR